MITLSEEQISEGGIQLAAVRSGTAVELVFPATVAASPNASARIDARASGVVRSVGKTLGDYVARGETVARIESADAAALASQVSAARARVSELSAAYERERRLFEENVTARQDLEAAQANLSVARSEFQRAQAAVAAAGVSGDGGSLAVTSPLAGRITAAPIVLGAFVDAGGIIDGAGIAAVLDLGAVAAQLGTAFIACPESAADDAYRATLNGLGAYHTVLTSLISGRPARSVANRFTAMADRLGERLPPDYPIAYDAGKALHAAAKAKGEHGFGAQWAGQGAPLNRAMPAASLVQTLRAELQRSRSIRTDLEH